MVGDVADIGKEGAVEEIIQIDEETQPRKPIPTPAVPSQSDIDEHRIDHIPYRSWCRECVEEHAREWRHTHDDDAKGTCSFDSM